MSGRMVAIVLLWLAPTAVVLGQDAASIVSNAESYLLGGEGIYDTTVTSTRDGKATYVSEERFVANRKGSVVEIETPSFDAGKKILLERDAIWYYLPDAGRCIRVSPRSLALGSDFNYSDLTTMDLLANYEILSLRRTPSPEGDRYVIELHGVKDWTYERIEYVIDSASSLPISKTFYSLSGEVMRRINYDRPLKFAGRTQIGRWTVVTTAQANESCTMVFNSFKPAVFPQRFFTRFYLERGGQFD